MLSHGCIIDKNIYKFVVREREKTISQIDTRVHVYVSVGSMPLAGLCARNSPGWTVVIGFTRQLTRLMVV